MTHAKTQRREEEKAFGKLRELFGLRAPLRRFRECRYEHESFARCCLVPTLS